MTLLTEHCERFINVGDSLSNPKGSIFKTNENIVKFGLFRGTEYLGIGELQVNDEVRWVTVHNDYSKRKFPTVNDSIRLRVQCTSLNIQKKLDNNSSKSKLHLGTCPELKRKKKPVIRISNIMGDLSQNLDKKNNSFVKFGKNIQTTNCKQEMEKTIQDKSSDTHLNILNTEVCASTLTMNSVKSNKTNKKANNNKAKNISKQLASSDIFNRTDYKNNCKQKIIKNDEYVTCKLPNKTALEDQIIDQSFENNIKKDEIINQKSKENSTEEKELILIENDDNLCDGFSILKTDFFILYDSNYLSEAPMDTIRLETEIFIEKVSDLQSKYYSAMREMDNHYHLILNKTREAHEALVQLIKMKNKLNLCTERIDYTVRLQSNMKNKKDTIDLYKEEYSFWNQALEKGKGLIPNQLEQRDLTQRNKQKEILLEIICQIFGRRNTNRDIIRKAKDNYLNPYQQFFLRKILEKALKKYESINPKKRNVEASLAIESLRDNLKTKMLPVFTSNDNTINTINSHSNQQVISQKNIEPIKYHNGSNLGSILKCKHKKSESDVYHISSSSKKAISLKIKKNG